MSETDVQSNARQARKAFLRTRDLRLAAVVFGVPVIGLGLFYLYTLLFDFAGNQ